jgi:hypothetical protein
MKVKKSEHSLWHSIESVGDAAICTVVRNIFTELFGEQNSLTFFKLLEDHAKSNVFLSIIAQFYELQRWVAKSPRNLQEWAHLAEVFFGAVFIERSLWGNDPLKELHDFFLPILKIRYRGLLQFSTKDWVSWNTYPALTSEEKYLKSISVQSQHIFYPTAPIFEQVKVLLKDRDRRFLGHLAIACVNDSSESAEAFHPIEKEAKHLATRLLLNRLHHSNTSIKTHSSALKTVRNESSRYFCFIFISFT